MKVLLFIAATIFWSDSNPSLSHAKQLISSKKYSQAIEVLNSSEDIRAQYYLGWCFLKLNRCAEANTHFDRFISEYTDNNLWVEEAKKNKMGCAGAVASISQNKKIAPDITLKKHYKKINDDYQIAMASLQKSIVNAQNIQFDSISSSPIINFKRVKKSTVVEDLLKEDLSKDVEVNQKIEPAIVNNTTTEEPEIKTIVNNPMTEEPDTKTIVNNPMTEEPDRKAVAPKTTSDDITVTSKSHHYKILFAIENTPDKIYISLADVGPVSNEKVNGNNYMYYIGFYPTKEKADEALQKVKAKGYGVARVMEFNKGALEMEHLEPKVQQTVSEVLDKKVNPEPKPTETLKTEPEVVESKEPEKPEEQIQEVINSDVVSYHILFRVLPNPYEKFDELKQFGALYRETFDKNGNSRYLIGNTDDIKEAKSLLEKVKKAGYGASMVAEYVNGQLSKIVTE